MYLGRRDFIDHLDHVDPIEGIVVVESDYLNGRKLYGQVTTTYRYGREEDEMMGLKFSRELVIARKQLVPPAETKTDLSTVQVIVDISASPPLATRSTRSRPTLSGGLHFQGKKVLGWQGKIKPMHSNCQAFTLFCFSITKNTNVH